MGGIPPASWCSGSASESLTQLHACTEAAHIRLCNCCCWPATLRTPPASRHDAGQWDAEPPAFCAASFGAVMLIFDALGRYSSALRLALPCVKVRPLAFVCSFAPLKHLFSGRPGGFDPCSAA